MNDEVSGNLAEPVWYGSRDMSVEMSSDSIVLAAKDQVSSDLGGEAAILDLKVGIYYDLDEARDSTEVLQLTHFPPVVRTRT
jgi:hypothetical protein